MCSLFLTLLLAQFIHFQSFTLFIRFTVSSQLASHWQFVGRIVDERSPQSQSPPWYRDISVAYGVLSLCAVVGADHIHHGGNFYRPWVTPWGWEGHGRHSHRPRCTLDGC